MEGVIGWIVVWVLCFFVFVCVKYKGGMLMFCVLSVNV